MDPRRTRALSVGLLTSALVLGGCSKGPTPPPLTASTPAATSSSVVAGAVSPEGSPTTPEGDEVRGRSGGFTVVSPEGWVEATDKAKGVTGVDLVLLSSKKIGGFANNLVVTASDGERTVLDDELAAGKQQLGAAGRAISSAPDKSVAGATAVGFTTTFEQGGLKLVARSYGIERGGRIYLLTLSSSQADATHAMTEFDELLSTWAWT